MLQKYFFPLKLSKLQIFFQKQFVHYLDKRKNRPGTLITQIERDMFKKIKIKIKKKWVSRIKT